MANQKAGLLPEQLLDHCKQQRGVWRKTSPGASLPWDARVAQQLRHSRDIYPTGWIPLQG